MPSGPPGRVAGVEKVAGNAMDLGAGHAPDINRRKAIGIAEGKGEVPAVVGPSVVAQISAVVLGDLNDFFVVQSEDVEFAVFV